MNPSSVPLRYLYIDIDIYISRYIYLLQLRSVFLKDLQATPLKCNPQEGEVPISQSVGGYHPNLIIADKPRDLITELCPPKFMF